MMALVNYEGVLGNRLGVDLVSVKKVNEFGLRDRGLL